MSKVAHAYTADKERTALPPEAPDGQVNKPCETPYLFRTTFLACLGRTLAAGLEFAGRGLATFRSDFALFFTLMLAKVALESTMVM